MEDAAVDKTQKREIIYNTINVLEHSGGIRANFFFSLLSDFSFSPNLNNSMYILNLYISSKYIKNIFQKYIIYT